MLEIDGLAKEILDEAIEKGYMPTLKRWIENKTHTLKRMGNRPVKSNRRKPGRNFTWK